MVRCGCSSDKCSCHFIEGDGVTISGTGTRSNPYVVEVAQSSVGGGGGGFFSGMIMAYGGAVAPAGWLMCDGSAVSRAVYSSLFTAIGVANGAGDGTTTFNLPNGAGRVLLGSDGAHPRGATGGVAANALTVANLPAHTHSNNHDHASFNTASSGSHTHNALSNAADGADVGTYRSAANAGRALDDGQLVRADLSNHTHPIDVPPYVGSTGSTGSGAGLDNMPPFFTGNYIIKT